MVKQLSNYAINVLGNDYNNKPLAVVEVALNRKTNEVQDFAINI